MGAGEHGVTRPLIIRVTEGVDRVPVVVENGALDLGGGWEW